jgi:hypothetical protein
MACTCTKCDGEIKPFQKVLVEVDSHEFGKEGDSRKVWILGTHTGMNWLILTEFGTGKNKSSCRIQATSEPTHPDLIPEYVRGFRVICKKCRTIDGWSSKLEHKTYELGTRGNRLNPKFMVHVDGSFEEAPSCLGDSDTEIEDKDSEKSEASEASDTESSESSEEDIEDFSDEEKVKPVVQCPSVVPASPCKSAGSKRSSSSMASMASQDVGSCSGASGASKASSKAFGTPERCKIRKVECPGAPARPSKSERMASAIQSSLDNGCIKAEHARLLRMLAGLEGLEDDE